MLGTETTNAQENLNESTGTLGHSAEEKRGKKKIGLILGISISAVLVVVISVISMYFMFFKESACKLGVSAYISSDGTAYLCYDNGKTVKIKGDIEDAYITPDRKKIIVIEDEGDIYWTDAKKKEKHKIAEADKDTIFWLESVTNKFVAFGSEENDTEIYFRYDFEIDETVVITSFDESDDDDDCEYTSSVAYPDIDDISFLIAKDGKINILSSKMSEPECIEKYSSDKQIYLLGISADGDLAAWEEIKDGKSSLIVYRNGETEKLDSEELQEYNDRFEIEISPDGSTAVIIGFDKTIFIQEDNVQKVSLPDNVEHGNIYTSNGEILALDHNASKANGYYVNVEDSVDSEGYSLCSVYYINFEDGERTKLISKIYMALYADNQIVYLDEDENLNISEIDTKSMELGEESRISNEVYNLAGTTEHIYYIKNLSDDGTFDLYMYDVEKQDSEKLDSNADYNIYTDVNGKMVYYFTDVVYGDNSQIDYGTLKCYNSKTEEIQKISDDVVTKSLTSNLLWNAIDCKSLWFEKYVEPTDRGYVFNVCHYNGKKVSAKVKNSSK